METQGIEQTRPAVVLAVHHEGDETPTIAALAAALSKAQGAMKPATKDSKNPHFGSQYADFASIVAACRGPLSANGLAFVQRVSTTEGAVVVVTRLMHSSGEWMQDRCVMPVAQKTPQGYGSAVTYAKRYALAALVGVAADDDDDGNAASSGPSRQEPPAKARKAEPEAKRETKAAPTPEQAEKQLLATRVRRLWETAQKNGMTTEGFRAWAAGLLEEDKSSKDWSAEQVTALEAEMRQASINGREADVPH